MTEQQQTEAAAAERWRRLTWDDLEAWAGPRSLERGRRYQRQGRVRALARTEDGALVAWVHGTERYAAEVRLADGPALGSRCTCPVGDRCKHAVAVVVDYLDALKQGRDVPAARASDPRRDFLNEGDAFEEDDTGDEDEEAPAPRRPPGGRRDDVRAYLEGLPAADLVACLLDLAGRHPEIDRELKARGALARGEAGELVRAARREIRRLTHEPAWVNAWTGEGELPDYGGLKRLFERLLEMGEADALLGLGEALLEAGTEQVNVSHDEGETASAIGDCLAVVFRAVPAAGRPDADKLLYALGLTLRDEYDLCAGADAVLGRAWPAAAWSAVADKLAGRLRDLPAPRGDDFTDRYRRDRLSDWLARALRQAGRGAEVVPLLEAEARLTGRYDRLVDALLAARRPEEARRRAVEGIERVGRRWPGLAEQLRGRLRDLAERHKDWPAVAALRAEEFFARPSVASLAALERAAERAGCRPEVRAAALHFLETGARPAPAAPAPTAVARSRRPARRRPAAPTQTGSSPWPLPDLAPELRLSEGRARVGRDGPHYDVLLELALKEKRPDDVLRWYDAWHDGRRAGAYGWAGLEGRVADAVAATHPDRAAALYRDLVAGCVARASPSAYEEALPPLRKLRDLLRRLGRGEEWRQYLAGLREAERRKRRLLEVLDRLERRPIVDG